MSKPQSLVRHEIEDMLSELNSLLYDLHRQQQEFERAREEITRMIVIMPAEDKNRIRHEAWISKTDKKLAETWRKIYSRKTALLRCFHELKRV